MPSQLSAAVFLLDTTPKRNSQGTYAMWSRKEQYHSSQPRFVLSHPKHTAASTLNADRWSLCFAGLPHHNGHSLFVPAGVTPRNRKASPRGRRSELSRPSSSEGPRRDFCTHRKELCETTRSLWESCSTSLSPSNQVPQCGTADPCESRAHH